MVIQPMLKDNSLLSEDSEHQCHHQNKLAILINLVLESPNWAARNSTETKARELKWRLDKKTSSSQRLKKVWIKIHK